MTKSLTLTDDDGDTLTVRALPSFYLEVVGIKANNDASVWLTAKQARKLAKRLRRIVDESDATAVYGE